jgi:putative ABC transport system ATP-binding protein
MTASSTLITLSEVTKTYRLGDEEIYALDHVSLTVNQGEFLAIIGPSGSGKSTLSNVIGGLDRPDSGKVMVAGQDLSKMRDKKMSAYRNNYVGFVFQSFNLQSHLTALENVALPLMLGGMPGKKRNARAHECLELVGVSDRERHRPNQLSGGQRQRVAIARALANNPKLIIADEPTGNLDSQRGKEILALLHDLNKQGVTIIVVTHDMDIAKTAQRIVSLHDGKLVEGVA